MVKQKSVLDGQITGRTSQSRYVPRFRMNLARAFSMDSRNSGLPQLLSSSQKLLSNSVRAVLGRGIGMIGNGCDAKGEPDEEIWNVF
jgi:hypothetical protein